MSIDDELEREVHLLKPEDGDVVVLTTPRSLPDSARRRIYAFMQELIENRLKIKAHVMILEDGMDVKILRTSELPKIDKDPTNGPE